MKEVLSYSSSSEGLISTEVHWMRLTQGSYCILHVPVSYLQKWKKKKKENNGVLTWQLPNYLKINVGDIAS